MLQNEHKRFTVIVIVVDLDMKLNDLPLDLQTLSPILKSERYFETRLAKAFGKLWLMVVFILLYF